MVRLISTILLIFVVSLVLAFFGWLLGNDYRTSFWVCFIAMCIVELLHQAVKDTTVW